MQDLIASFLFQHKSCPLPGLGSLYMEDQPSLTDFTNKKISAPFPTIRFRQEDMETDQLLAYVAKKTNTTADQAQLAFHHFWDGIKNELAQSKEASLPAIGKFFVDELGQLDFKPTEIPPSFFPAVAAERVIHPDAEHSILVGDMETTNTQMAEYYSEEPEKMDRWWIGAIVLGVIGILVLLIYLNDSDSSLLFGNAGKI